MPDTHTHLYRGETSFNNGHKHGYWGVTSPSPDVPGHTHDLGGRTCEQDRHMHRYTFATGPERGNSGGHVHYFVGAAEYSDGHIHTMAGYTSADSAALML
jgi:hypothetical protein